MRVELSLALGQATATAVLLWSNAPAGPRPIAGVLAFAIPAVAWSRAIFRPGSIDVAERALSVLCLFFATTLFLTVALHLLPAGITRRSWSVGLAAVFVPAFAVELWTSRRRPPVAAASRHARPGIRQAVPLVAAAAALATTVVLARTPSAPPKGVTGYTQLWLVPGQGTAQLGVGSFELHDTSYRLDLLGTGGVARRWRLRLRPGQRWNAPLPSGVDAPEARLFRTGDTKPYRIVRASSATPVSHP